MEIVTSNPLPPIKLNTNLSNPLNQLLDKSYLNTFTLDF